MLRTIKYKNYTGSDIFLIDRNGMKHFIKSDGNVKATIITSSEFSGMSIIDCHIGKLQGLPEFEENTYVIVGNPYFMLKKGRPDLVYPCNPEYNSNGEIVGYKTLQHVNISGL